MTRIDPELNQKLRQLAHDLSNALETITQASYLLGQAELDATSRKWVTMIDAATREAAGLNLEIRDILRSLTAAPPAAKPKVSKSRSSSGRSRKSGT